MLGDWESLNSEIILCNRCPRLVMWRTKIANERKKAFREYTYWGKPVPGFGDINAQILVLGLAPGAHGSNRTGRMFTGDSSGIFLYNALHQSGFANQPNSTGLDDGLVLNRMFISAVCRCAPPGNKPLPLEINNCRSFLIREIEYLPNIRGLIALGRIAFDNIVNIYVPQKKYKFMHCGEYFLGENLPWLIASYHPSRQNTQTGRLTEEMFSSIWGKALEFLG
jgi:uracil-DNA glycosylase family 4